MPTVQQLPTYPSPLALPEDNLLGHLALQKNHQQPQTPTQTYSTTFSLFNPLLILPFFLAADTIYLLLLYRSCRVTWHLNRPAFSKKCIQAVLLGLGCCASSALYVFCLLMVVGDGAGLAYSTSPSWSINTAETITRSQSQSQWDDTHGYNLSTLPLHPHQAHHHQPPSPNQTPLQSLKTLLFLIPPYILYFTAHQASTRFARRARYALVDSEAWIWDGKGGPDDRDVEVGKEKGWRGRTGLGMIHL